MQREIQVIANSQNKNEIYMSNAETLGELKAELINKGYQVEDMDIKEGKSRTDLTDEMTPLPSNFNYKGVETNDLVIMITPRNTKIKSGITPRQELYAKITQYNLQGKCVQEFGQNYTRCKSVDLAYLIDLHESQNNETATTETPTPGVNSIQTEETVREIVNDEINKREAKAEYTVNSLAIGFLKVINFLEGLKIGEVHLISKRTLDTWRKSIRKDYTPYTKEELDAMSK